MRWVRGHAAWIAISFVAALAVALLAPIDYHDRDFAGFWIASRMIIEGKDPYDGALWLPALAATAPRLASAVPSGTGYGYPLWTALLTLPFALVPFEAASRAWLGAQVFLALVAMGAIVSVLGLARRAVLVWLVAEVAVGLVAIHLLLLALGVNERSADALFTTALLVGTPPVYMLVEIGNVGGFVLALVAGGLALLLSGYAIAAGVLLGLMLLKPHLVLFLVPAVAAVDRETRVRLVVGCVASAVVLVLASVAVRPTWLAEWTANVVQVNAGVGPRATAWGLGPMLGVPGVLLAIVVIAVYAYWARSGASVPSLYAGALAVSLFVAPYAGRYDAIALLPSLAIGLATATTPRPKTLPIVLALVLLVASPLQWLLHILVFAHINEAIGSLVPIAVFAVVVACDRLARERRLA